VTTTPTAAHRAGAPVEQVLGQVRQWATDLPPAVDSPEQRAAVLAALRQLADATEAVFTAVLARFDACGDGQLLRAAPTTASWLRADLKLAPGDAAQRVGIARRSRDLLASPLAALAAGTVTFDQVRAVHRGSHRLPEACQADAVALLTDLAVAADITAVRVAGQRIQHVVDPGGALNDAQTRFDRRYLTLSPLLDGMTAVDGLLDAEAATALTDALAPSLVPAGPDDVRTAAQRRADGLVDLALGAVGGDADSRARPTLYVTMSLDLLLGEPGASPAALPDAPGGTGWLTADAVSRLACDASVSRVLWGPGSVPVELGRRHRLFTPGQRQLLALRDGGCRFPGCHRPPRFTDAHHLVPWQRGGDTSIANGVLLCRWHHRHVHEYGWRVTPDDPASGANGRLTFGGPHRQRLSSDPRGP